MLGSNDHSASEQIGQVLLRLRYQQLRSQSDVLPDLADVEFRCYSQNGEDGILLYLFSMLGTANRTAVEICAGNGVECNAANLIINHGWRGLLIDGDKDQIAQGKAFYAASRNTAVSPPTLVPSWVTAENVNALIQAQGIVGEVDLLSLDLDGNDYWIWKALDCIKPRVVVLEFNAACGPEKRLTIPYRPDFRLDFSIQPYRCGASLPAFAELGRQKGYRLIGVQSLGFNAFFVRQGLGEDIFPELRPQECYDRNERLRAWAPSWLEPLYGGGFQWEEV
jgi:hypothetical protein